MSEQDALATKDTQRILLALCENPEPIGYGALRRSLGIPAQAFRQSFNDLEKYAMIGIRLRGGPNASGQRQVYLEATALGRLWAQQIPGPSNEEPQ